MNTVQLTQLLEADPYGRGVFVGVYPRDRLPRTVKTYPSAYVWNTDPHTTNGEHWISVFLDECGRGEYFDPYGFPPLYQTFRNFLNKHCTSWTFNDMQLQGLTSSVCGHYCVLYLLHRCRGLSLKTVTDMFGANVEDNDVLVREYLIGHFSR